MLLFLYVTHDQTEAMALADRIGVLRDGQLMQVGNPREIYEKPANIYVAKILGTPMINILSPKQFDFKYTPSNAQYVGIRPENISIHKTNGMEAKVLIIECLGAETIALLEMKNEKVYCLLDDNDVDIEENDIVFLEVNEDNIIFFDENENYIEKK